MNKMARVIAWTAVNGTMAWFLYLATVRGYSGPGNVVRFFVVFNFIICLICAFSDDVKAKARERGPSVPMSINMAYGFVFAGVLAYFGWFWMAGLDIASTLLQLGIYSTDDKEKKE